MSVNSLPAPSAQTLHSVQQPQKPQRAAGDRDGDGDNDATESAAAKAKEVSKPVNSNLGNKLNVAV